jgi:hypothetical protein
MARLLWRCVRRGQWQRIGRRCCLGIGGDVFGLGQRFRRQADQQAAAGVFGAIAQRWQCQCQQHQQHGVQQ